MNASHTPRPTANRLFSQFPHERGPNEPCRTIASGVLREWPDLWKADPRLLLSIGDDEVRAIIRRDPRRLRYFSATDPKYPSVPLLRVRAETVPQLPTRKPLDPRLPPDTGIRDKVWQRLVMEEIGHLPQPGFAVVDGTQIQGCNAPWVVHVATLDCRVVRAELLTAAVPGNVVVLEGVDVGFAAVVTGDGVRLMSRNPHIATHLNGATECSLSTEQWTRFIRDLCEQPLPINVTKTTYNPVTELGDALPHSPGSYILKPRFGSNGFCVTRIVSHADGTLTVESDCPDTTQYLEEFPADPDLRGRDLVTAAATHRSRFIDRATVGIPERALNQSILEEEIRQDRSEGSIFEPRIVVQRMKAGLSESFATLGAMCKRIDTAIGASVVRDFREEPLDVSLRRFLRGRVPASDLASQVRRTHDEILAAGDRTQVALVPLVEAGGARVHQFAIDCRLCWNPVTERAEYPFLELQFGIGRIDGAAFGSVPLAGYRTRDELADRFGPEFG